VNALRPSEAMKAIVSSWQVNLDFMKLQNDDRKCGGSRREHSPSRFAPVPNRREFACPLAHAGPARRARRLRASFARLV